MTKISRNQLAAGCAFGGQSRHVAQSSLDFDSFIYILLIYIYLIWAC